MKTKVFVSACFYALLLIFLVAIMPSEAGETKKSEINIGVHGYANWLGKGTVLQGGDRNTNECGGAIWKGSEGENNDRCGDGTEGHYGKGYVHGTWNRDHGITKGTGWWASSGKGVGGGKGGKDEKGGSGGGGYKIPIPSIGKGGGGKGGGDAKL